MNTSDKKIISEAESIEMDSSKEFCKPFKGELPFDGNFYFYEFAPNCTIIVSASDVLLGNRVLGMGLDERISNDLIKEIISFFQKAKRPRFFMQICPIGLTDGVKELLLENNAEHKSNWVKLFKHVEKINPEQRTSEIVIRGPEAIETDEIANLLLKSFSLPSDVITFCKEIIGKPGWKNFVALIDNKIAGTGSVYIKGENAELAVAATDESFRGRGIQTSLIIERELFALKNNCKKIFVETAEPTPEFKAPSYRNMIRLGYTELYRRPNYLVKL